MGPRAWARPAARGLLAVMLSAGVATVQASDEVDPDTPDFEGAIGSIVSYGPRYPGAADSGFSAVPALYLRYKRLSVSSKAGFIGSHRRGDEVFSGLGLDLVESRLWRVRFGLRLDRGRRESDEEAFRGLGDIPTTVRTRIGLTRFLDDGWRLGGSWTADVMNRGGGHLFDVSAVREWPLSPTVTVTAGAWLTAGSSRYLQTHFGIDETQSAASGYPVFRPQQGLRDLNTSVSWRFQLGPHWTAMVGASANGLLGPAADSPLARQRWGWSTSAGLAWRF